MITIEEVKKLAKLAKLEFKPEELEKFQIQLSDILDYVVQLSKVGTDGVEPTSQVTGLENIVRSDEVQKWSESEDILVASNLPRREGMIEVPSVFEKG